MSSMFAKSWIPSNISATETEVVLKTVIVRRVILVISISVAAVLLCLVGMFSWASSGRYTRTEYKQGFVHESEECPQGQGDGRYTIVTYNVGYGSGLTNNSGNNASEAEYKANEVAIATALKGVEPDIVVYQEIDFDSDRSYHSDQLTLFADALGMKYRAQAFNWDKNYVPWPYWPPSGHFKRMLSGQAISSTFPVRQHRKHTLSKPPENPFWYNRFYLDRVVQIAEL
jgi:hypothetical protein